MLEMKMLDMICGVSIIKKRNLSRKEAILLLVSECTSM